MYPANPLPRIQIIEKCCLIKRHFSLLYLQLFFCSTIFDSQPSNMKNSIVYILFICLLAISCSTKTEKKTTLVEEIETKSTKPGFIHAVYFWLKKDNPELLKEFKEVALPKLATVPSIKNVYWGPPAGTPRDVVDNSYDISWIVTFNNAAEQEAYQIDPMHLEFVEKYKSLFEKVQVYDNLVEHGK